MRRVVPTVHLISQPAVDWLAMKDVLIAQVGKETAWFPRVVNGDDIPEAETLVEFGGRMCYRSWEPGLNANVTKVREDSKEYLWNILHSGHGSVLEHANFTFVFSNVSRVFTHEFVRHRAGVAISQESMRFVRLTDLPMWFPQWALEDGELMQKLIQYITDAEHLQVWMARHFDLDNQTFDVKKKKTSFMRRFAPSGHATNLMATVNARAMRHIISMRTDPSAEEEIQIVIDKMAEMALEAWPNFMQDFQALAQPDGPSAWVPEFWGV